jgi:uncharacterized protein (DUF2384 family)
MQQPIRTTKAQSTAEPTASAATSTARARTRLAKTVDATTSDLHWQNFREIFHSAPSARVDLIRKRVAAVEFKRFAIGLGVPQERVFHMLDISTSTVNRKSSRGEALTLDQSARIVGLAKMIGQVETMIAESGDPSESEGFHAGVWLVSWMEQPFPALGGRRPAEYMDTIEGQQMIARLLAIMQTGAYA